MRLIIINIFCLIGLSGCQYLAYFTDQIQPIGKEIAEAGIQAASMTAEFVTPHSHQIHEKGWTYGNRENPPLPQLYCYQTIGGVNCFAHPRPGHGWTQQKPAPDVTPY